MAHPKRICAAARVFAERRSLPRQGADRRFRVNLRTGALAPLPRPVKEDEVTPVGARRSTADPGKAHRFMIPAQPDPEAQV